MASHSDHLSIATGSGVRVVNITREVAAAVARAALRDGLLCVSVRHATCALVLNEDEEGLTKDLERVAASLLDPLREARSFLHDRIDNNAQAHLTACLLGPSVTVPVEGGRMALGTWQCLLLVELDGPRARTVDVTLVG